MPITREFLQQALADNVTELIFRDQLINDQDMDHLSAELSNFENLTRLELSGNNIDARHMRLLVERFDENPNLIDLTIANNPRFRDREGKGSLEVAALLLECPNLQRLDLHDNNWGFRGGLEIGNALRNVVHLQRLNLRGNDLGQQGGMAIVEALPHCPELTDLSFSGNGINDIVIFVLSQILVQCRNMSRLSLSDNMITDASALALIPIIPRCPNLVVIELDTNVALSRELKQEIKRLLAENQRLLAENNPAEAALVALAPAAEPQPEPLGEPDAPPAKRPRVD